MPPTVVTYGLETRSSLNQIFLNIVNYLLQIITRCFSFTKLELMFYLEAGKLGLKVFSFPRCLHPAPLSPEHKIRVIISEVAGDGAVNFTNDWQPIDCCFGAVIKSKQNKKVSRTHAVPSGVQYETMVLYSCFK